MSCKNKKLKILFVSPLPPPAGGIATWTEQLIEILKNEHAIEFDIVDTAVRWRTQTDRNILKRILGGSFQSFMILSKTIIKLFVFNPTAIHICSSFDMSFPRDFIILLISKIFRKKSFIHFRMGKIPEIVEKRGVFSKLLEITIKMSDTAIVLDEKSMESLQKIGMKNVVKIPNFISMESVNKVVVSEKTEYFDKNSTHFLFVGHIVPTKGIRELFEGLANLKRNDLKLHLVGPIEESFKNELDQYNLGEKVIFHGKMEKSGVISTMKDCDAFIFPTYTEGFPNVIMEAMACNLPIISTDVGAIPEMLNFDTETPCGYKIEKESSKSIAEAINCFLENRSKFKTLAERAKNKVAEQYSAGVVIEKYIKMWEKGNLNK